MGPHVQSRCGTVGPWNKGLVGVTVPWNRGLTKETSASVRSTSEKAKAMSRDPEWKARWAEGHREGQRKRFEDPAERAASRERALQMIQDGKVIPYGGRAHGNGATPTESEAEMLRRLRSHGFTGNYVLMTGVPRGNGYPTAYKIDLANEAAKVAVEIDGSSHGGAARREADAKKTSFLESKGWRVLRFRLSKGGTLNYDEATHACVQAVREARSSTTSRRRAAST